MAGTLYRDAALADATGPELTLGVSVLVVDEMIAWIRLAALVSTLAVLESWQALAAATRNGGTLIGEPDASRIREGGPADFSLVHGDPLSDPSALWRVWRLA